MLVAGDSDVLSAEAGEGIEGEKEDCQETSLEKGEWVGENPADWSWGVANGGTRGEAAFPNRVRASSVLVFRPLVFLAWVGTLPDLRAGS